MRVVVLEIGTMRRALTFFCAIVCTTVTVVTMASSTVGCNLLGGQSRVKSGELFEPGSEKYDAYFKEVHDLQVASIGWSDERKASCRPLVDALKLMPEAAEVSIVQGTHERVTNVGRDVGPTKLEVVGDEVHLVVAVPGKVDEPTRDLFRAVEVCAHAEAARAKALRVIPTKVDEITKSGHELEPHIRDDFAKRGGRAGLTVQDEMNASYEVLATISKDARNGARGAEDFVADLQRAIESEKSGEASEPKEAKEAKPEAKPDAKPAPKQSAKPGKPKPGKPKPAEAEDPPPPKPKPKPKPADPTGEVFNP